MGGVTLVDENYEALQYINGNDISKNNLYRICYLMIKWYKEDGLSKFEIRQKIYDWAEEKFYIKYNVNDIIDRVFDSKLPGLKSMIVKINKQDIKNINKRFDNKTTKFVALAMLCYAKAHANRDGEFNISSVSMSSWLNMNRKTLRHKYIKELVEYEYLTEVAKPENNKKWANVYEEQSIRYKINVQLHNSGEVVLENNDIRILFDELFSTPI